MRHLPPLEDVASVVLEPAGTIDLGAPIGFAHETNAGWLVGSGGVLHVITATGDRTVELPVPVHDGAGSRVDVCGDRLVVAGDDRVSIFAGGRELWSRSHGGGDEVSCVFTCDHRVVVLVERGDDVTLELVDGARVIDAVPIDLARGEGAAWWLDCPHPSEPTVPLSAGMGQDGSLSVFVTVVDGKLRLGDARRDVCFTSWSRSGAAVHVGHHDGVVAVGARSRDLGPFFEDLDDGHNSHASCVDDDRVLVPTIEGRIVVAALSGAEPVEVRLRDDDRNWDWRVVALVGDRLVTGRSGDTALRTWDARGLA